MGIEPFSLLTLKLRAGYVFSEDFNFFFFFFEIRCSEIVSEAILGQKQSRTVYALINAPL